MRLPTRRLSITHNDADRALEEGYWMSDKPLVQQALAAELADILLRIPDPSSSFLFLKGFWQTVVREWHGIDRLRWAAHTLKFVPPLWLTCRTHRMDKYYMLVRRFVNASFVLLIKNQWSPSLCEEHNAILCSAGGPLWYVRFGR